MPGADAATGRRCETRDVDDGPLDIDDDTTEPERALRAYLIMAAIPVIALIVGLLIVLL